MDEFLKTYEEYLQKINEDPTYDPTPEENTAIFNIENDPKYADLANELLDSNSYEVALERFEKYVKEDKFNKENLSFDDSLGEDKEHMERVIINNKNQYGITDDLELIKSNLSSFANNPEAIDNFKDETTKEFYYKCYDDLYGTKQKQLDKDKVVAKSLTYMYPNQQNDLKNAGYINLLFAAFILTAIAFVVLFKLF